MFVITDMQTIHTEIVATFLIYIQTKFYIPSSSGPLVITIRLEAK
jgi:hypothetical protein